MQDNNIHSRSTNQIGEKSANQREPVIVYFYLLASGEMFSHWQPSWRVLLITFVLKMLQSWIVNVFRQVHNTSVSETCSFYAKMVRPSTKTFTLAKDTVNLKQNTRELSVIAKDVFTTYSTNQEKQTRLPVRVQPIFFKALYVKIESIWFYTKGEQLRKDYATMRVSQHSTLKLSVPPKWTVMTPGLKFVRITIFSKILVVCKQTPPLSLSPGWAEWKR